MTEATAPKKRVGIVEVARAAGVSPSAVSSVFRSADGKGRVSDKTRAAIMDACRNLGYEPLHAPSKAQIRPELSDYCFALSSAAGMKFRTGYYADLISCVTNSIPEPDGHFHLCRFSVDTDYLSHPEMLPLPIRNNTVNKVLCAGRVNLTLIEALRMRNLAIVNVGQEVLLGGITSVLPDFQGGASLAIEHLISLGHRRIVIGAGAFSAGDSNTLSQRRGIEETMQRHQLELDNANLCFNAPTIEGGRAVMEELIKHSDRATALYCINDAMAMGAILQARERNIRVPEDLSVIGFDDIQFSSVFTPPLTTVHVPIDEVARRSVEESEKLAENPVSPETPHKSIILPTHLIERQTTTRPAL